jgi:hypothetical protein
MVEVSKRSADLLCSPILSEAKGLSFLKKGGVTYVTEQGVTEQNFCGCAFCVNARSADQNFRVNPTVSFFNESGGFYPFWEKVDASYAWDAWRDYYMVMWDGIAGRWRRK